MLFKVFLLSHNTSFFDLKCLHIFELDLGLFAQYLSDNPFKVVVDLGHDLDLTLLDLIS